MKFITLPIKMARIIDGEPSEDWYEPPPESLLKCLHPTQYGVAMVNVDLIETIYDNGNSTTVCFISGGEIECNLSLDGLMTLLDCK